MPGRLLPEPARRLACCRPFLRPFPSGRALAHSLYCRDPKTRGQKLSDDERAELGLAPRNQERRILTPAEANELEPVGELALRCWLSHSTGCGCFACRWTEQHLDEGDDDR